MQSSAMMKLIWVVQDSFQVSIDCFQGWGFYGLSRQLVVVCSMFLSSPGDKLPCIHFGILVLYESWRLLDSWGLWELKSTGPLVVLLVGLQVWKNFGSVGVVEKVAGTELESWLVHTRSFYVQNGAQMEFHNGELSNWLLIASGITCQG